MRFAEPSYLHLLWLLAPVALLLSWGLRRKGKLIQIFFGKEQGARLISAHFMNLQKKQAIYSALALLFGVLALAQPRWGFEWQEVRREGVDIVIALDVSNSMLAQDLKPSRLERARREISDFLNLLQGDRVGLIAFAGTAFVQCPLTLDYSAARIFLNSLDVDLIPVQGTNLGEAIRLSLKSFSSTEKKSRALILITDGEDQEGMAETAAKEALEAGVKIFAIGVGAEEGAPIPFPGGFKKDEAGEVVLTRLDEDALKSIAEITGGGYVRSVSGDMDLENIYFEQLQKKVDSRQLNTQREKKWQERFQWAAILSLIFLLLPWLSDRKTVPEKS